MEVKNKNKILQRRKEIEDKLLEMLKEIESDFSLEDIKNAIYNEEETDDMMKVVAMFYRGGNALELENIIKLTSDACNYFPHKTLKGLSPAEMMIKYEKEDKNKKQASVFENKKLTAKQKDLMWSGGGNGPYSQVNLIKQVRILNNLVSRIFLVVETEINPTTFEIIKENRNEDEFKNDIPIQQLLNHAEYRGPEFGYVVAAFEEEFIDDEVMVRAEYALKYTQESIIKMHDYVMREYL
ncbi:MAG: hypothetical protein Q8O66_03235 [bacterium]|nr:hypothetical protein [bacterium]